MILILITTFTSTSNTILNSIGGILEKVFTILWVIWTHKNNIIFKMINIMINVLEMTKKIMNINNTNVILIVLLILRWQELTNSVQVINIIIVHGLP